MKPFTQKLDPSLIAYSAVSSDGSVTVVNNNTEVLVATIPFSTGPMLLVSKMWAVVLYSFDAMSADGVNSFSYRDANQLNVSDYFGYQGGSPPTHVTDASGSMSFYAGAGGTDLSVSGAPSSGGWDFTNFVTVTETINGSGDLEIYLTVPVASAQAYTLRDFRVSAVYFGAF
ncbi:MAG: hypothetical protein ACLP1D_10330 [Xanthobacteraceae bacterium]